MPIDATTVLTRFRVKASARQVYLWLRLETEIGRNESRPWNSYPLTRLSPGEWEISVRLAVGRWRFRYYAEQDGTLFCTPPTEQTDGHIEGMDAVLDVRAPATAARQRVEGANLGEAGCRRAPDRQSIRRLAPLF